MRSYFSILPLLILPIVLLSPNVIVKWAQEKQGLLIELERQDMHVAQCIESGLEVRYRLEYQVCRRRVSWFDHCSNQELIARSVQYDPISESYSIETDSLADLLPANKVMETNADYATAKMTQFNIDAQGVLEESYFQSHVPGKYYISIRVRGYCQREEQSLLTQIPYYLTLGIFRFTGFDTGWIDYNLQ